MIGQPLADTADQKLRGGYYTPDRIARFLADWAIQNPSDTILEPSCGDGELLCAAARRLFALKARPTEIARQLQGVELFASEADLARARLDQLSSRPQFLRSFLMR